MKKDNITMELEMQIQELLEQIPNLQGEEKTKAIEDLMLLNMVLKERREGQAIKPWEAPVRMILDGIAIVVPLVLTAGFVAAGFEFEKTGTFTSKTLAFVMKFLKLK